MIRLAKIIGLIDIASLCTNFDKEEAETYHINLEEKSNKTEFSNYLNKFTRNNKMQSHIQFETNISEDFVNFLDVEFSLKLENY